MTPPPFAQAELEIRIRKRQDNGYPLDLMVNGVQAGPSHYLDPDLLPWRSDPSPEVEGERLFRWLFAGEDLRAAWIEKRSLHPERRIRLHLDMAAPELHSLPWEAFRDVLGIPAPQFIAASSATPFSRFLAVNGDPGEAIVERPIRILVAIANPVDLETWGAPQVVKDIELGVLEDATQGPEVTLVSVPEPCTLHGIEEGLRKGCHILHIISHGSYHPQEQAGGMLLADSQKRASWVNHVDFAAMLARHIGGVRTSSSAALRLVFLDVCSSAIHAYSDASRGFPHSLLQAGVPAVIAMQDRIPEITAREFTRTLYRRLLEHGRLDQACNEARATLLTKGLPSSTLPVLFSRLPGNQLLAWPNREARRSQPARLAQEPEMMTVPAGGFLMGPATIAFLQAGLPDGYELWLPDYRIGVRPVTNVQYAAFAKDHPDSRPRQVGWRFVQPPDGQDEQSVTGVSWYDAVAYCRWLSDRTGRRYRLSTEAEWEKACRAGDVARWQAGEILEWTSTLWGDDQAHPGFTDPYRADGRENQEAPPTVYRICRGGPMGSCTARSFYAPGTRDRAVGFRVARDA